MGAGMGDLRTRPAAVLDRPTITYEELSAVLSADPTTEFPALEGLEQLRDQMILVRPNGEGCIHIEMVGEIREDVAERPELVEHSDSETVPRALKAVNTGRLIFTHDEVVARYVQGVRPERFWCDEPELTEHRIVLNEDFRGRVALMFLSCALEDDSLRGVTSLGFVGAPGWGDQAFHFPARHTID